MNNDPALDYKQLLTDAIHKQIIILGNTITLTKARAIPGLTITDDGTVTATSPHPQNDITLFLEQFRDLSAPLVKKTMQPLLNAVTPAPNPTQPNATSENSAPAIKPENKNPELVPKT